MSSGEHVTEATMRAWAATDPMRLLDYIGTGLDIGWRTRATEAAGLIEDPLIAIPFLLGSLSHPQAIVREGAVYGAETHLELHDTIGLPDVEEWRAKLRAKLAEMAASDPSPGVRSACVEWVREQEELARG